MGNKVFLNRQVKREEETKSREKDYHENAPYVRTKIKVVDLRGGENE